MYTNRDMRNAALGAIVGVVVVYFIFGQKQSCGCKDKEGRQCR